MRPYRTTRRRWRPGLAAGAVLGLVACAEAPPVVDPTGRDLRASQVWAFTSTDLETWTAEPAPVAHGFDTLGLSARPDGSLWLTGLDHARSIPWTERWTGPDVHGFEFRDGRWRARTWDFDGQAPAPIDPQWFGDALWYIGREGVGVDPAHAAAPNGLYSSDRVGPRYAAVGLADPSPVEVGGALSVFVTVYGRGVVQLAGEPLAEVQHFPGVTVPYATMVDGTLWLLAQRVVGGRRMPVLAQSVDGRRFSAFQPVALPRGPRSCTSPVLGHAEDRWWLLCVDEGA